jgi:acyl-CoA synthetase (AMP-forming)/AMP-acid ligase II
MAVHYAEQLRRHARRSPERLALIDHGRSSTYAELDARVDDLARRLAHRGVSQGDRVAVLVDNGAVPLEVMLACGRVGAIYVPLDFRLSAGDVRGILSDADPVAVVVDEVYRETIEAVRGDLPGVALWVLTSETPVTGYVRYADLGAGHGPDAWAAPDVLDADPFCILYTSGTTGRPKGVVFTHGQAYDNAVAVTMACGVGTDSRYLVSYPHNSAGTVNHVWGPTLVAGGCIVMGPVKEFSAAGYFTTVQEHGVTHSQLVPTMLFRLLEFPARDQYDFSSLTSIGYASAPIPATRVRDAIEAFGPVLTQMYGMTETCSIATQLSKDDHVRAAAGEEGLLRSCGRPVSGVELRIVDERGEELPRGEVGEIAMRGRWMTSGYWRDPERSAEAIQDGWLRSGDVARMDEHDYVYVVDRKKDLIITGGANVASTEVEAALYRHPGVLEAAVIGLPDDQWGERVHAVVVLRPEAPVTADELVEHCRSLLTRYKCPKTLEIVERLPYTSTGKISKAELRATR